MIQELIGFLQFDMFSTFLIVVVISIHIQMVKKNKHRQTRTQIFCCLLYTTFNNTNDKLASSYHTQPIESTILLIVQLYLYYLNMA